MDPYIYGSTPTDPPTPAHSAHTEVAVYAAVESDIAEIIDGDHKEFMAERGQNCVIRAGY